MNRKTTTKWIMFSAIFWALCLASPGWSQTPPRYFGMNTGQMLDSESWPSVPLGSIRLWDTHTTWNNWNLQRVHTIGQCWTVTWLLLKHTMSTSCTRLGARLSGLLRPPASNASVIPEGAILRQASRIGTNL